MPDGDKTSASGPLPSPSPLDAPSAAPRTVEKTRAASTYVFLVVGVVLTLALLIFIVQSPNNRTEVGFLTLSYTLPVGINCSSPRSPGRSSPASPAPYGSCG